MTDTRAAEIAAQRLREAEATGVPCAPVRDLLGATDLAAAYAAQHLNTQRRLAAGAHIAGRKIGLTNPAVQQQLGVDQPDYGALFGDREVPNGGEAPWREMMQPRVETEIAFVLGRDLPSANIGAADMPSAIEFALVAIEIVGSRIENWDIRITDTIADNASASHFVLGHRPVRLHRFDLLQCAMTMELNGIQVSAGTGSNCLGSPVNAALWLAKTMAAHGQPLRAGDVVLTGALGPVVPVQSGDRVTAAIEGLGSVSVRFSPQ